jgi:aspartyl-tRNA(Asn)/glutamyl-tRNA(Gln) amidotransferase subunit A
MQLTDQSASELLTLLCRQEVSAEAVTGEFLQAIRQSDPQLRAFLRMNEDSALEQARSIDARRRRGEPLGRLAGLPIAIKDILCAAGERTTCGSRILESFVPPYDAHVISELRRADAVFLGRTNLDEFAMGSSTENSAFQVTRNPWDVERVPGGSSGGSAAAVASRQAPLALGTDTGGSIRQPASFCGVVGLKPTYGRVSRFGLVAFASSLDQIGTLTSDSVDCALLLEVIAGHDPRDSTSIDLAVPRYHATVNESLKPLVIGVAKEHFSEGLDPEVDAAVRGALQVYEKLGASIQEISLPTSPFAVAAYYIVATAEASSNLARFGGAHYGRRAESYSNLMEMYCRSREEGFGDEVKRRLMLGTYVLSSGYKEAFYVKALRVRRLIKRDFDKAFDGCDVIMGPTAPTPAFRVGEKAADPLAMYLSDIYTIGGNLAGIPGISVPCGFTRGGLPIGLQILAPAFQEEKLLRVARMHERVTEWHKKRPKSLKSGERQ